MHRCQCEYIYVVNVERIFANVCVSVKNVMVYACVACVHNSKHFPVCVIVLQLLFMFKCYSY